MPAKTAEIADSNKNVSKGAFLWECRQKPNATIFFFFMAEYIAAAAAATTSTKIVEKILRSFLTIGSFGGIRLIANRTVWVALYGVQL